MQEFRKKLTQQQSPLNQNPETKIIPEDNKIQYQKAYEQKPTQYNLTTNQKVDTQECNKKYMITNIPQLNEKVVEPYQGNLQQNTLPQRQSLLNPVINFFSCPFILFKNGIKAICNIMYNWINKNSEHSKKQ